MILYQYQRTAAVVGCINNPFPEVFLLLVSTSRGYVYQVYEYIQYLKNKFWRPQNKMMIQLKYSQIPVFLTCGDLYKSLYDDDETDISLPQQYCKLNIEIETVEDLIHSLLTTRFWGVPGVPKHILECLFGGRSYPFKR